MRIRGSAAIVTGAASGLGLATATRLVEAGAHVVLIDLAASSGDEVASRLGRAVFVAADVSDASQVQAAVDEANRTAPLRLLVNCAGVATPGKVLGRGGPLDLERFEQVVKVNLLGTFNVIRLAAAAMAGTEPLDGERGVIINTASVAAFDGQIGQPAYAASKGAVVSMTLPIARELAAHAIRVLTIAPGLFETPLLAALPEAARASLGQQVPHPGRLGQPAEYAALVMHMVENPYLNGETIRLDGAVRMAPR